MKLPGHRQFTGILLACLAWLSLGRPLSAHDLERTEVTLRFAPDATFELDIANDPDWLLLRLEPFAVESGIPGRPPVSPARPLSVTERDGLLASFAPVVIDRVVLWVDGREVRPSTAEFIAPRAKTSADDVSPVGTYRLRGRMPAGSQSLRWFYGIVIDPYPMTIHRADGRELKDTILGRAWSETFDLAGQFKKPPFGEIVGRYVALGFRYVVWTGLGQLLFVLGLLLMTRRLRPVLVQLVTFAVAQGAGFALTMSGVLTPSSRGVWPVIAISVAYVFVESLLERTLTRWRLAFIFVFGVFHGAQLTMALSEVGTPPAQVPFASAAFCAAVLAAEGMAVLVTLLAASAIKHRPLILNSEF